jgi:hypothetical protein
MALVIHVVAHQTTDVVLAACTSGDGKAATDLLAELVGDGLPISYASSTSHKVQPFSTIAATALVVEKVPGDPVAEVGNVFDAPLDFVIGRDAQGQAQSLNKASAITNPVVAGTIVTLQFPSPLDLAGRPGWIRLVDTTDTAFDTPVVFVPVAMNDLTHGTASVIAPPGTYSMLALVKGFAALVVDGVTVT